MIKKLSKYIITTVIMCLTFIVGFQTVYANAVRSDGGKSFVTSGGYDVTTPTLRMDGKGVSYCLNYDLGFPSGQDYRNLEEAYRYPEIRGALYYGFGGADSTLQDKYGIPDDQAEHATQIVIWRHAHDLGIDHNSGQFRNLQLKSNAHPNLLRYIEELASKRLNELQPIALSFDGEVNHEHDYQYSTPIQLSANIEYDVEFNTDVAQIHRKSNAAFSVRVPLGYKGTVVATVKPKVTNFTALVWRSSDSSLQDVINLGHDDPLRSISTTIQFNSIPSYAKVIKVDDLGNVVLGVTFEYSLTRDFSEYVYEKTTDENGIAIDEWNIGNGTIYIREKSVPPHLVKSDEVKEVQLKAGQTSEVTFTNQRVKGNIELIKVNAENTNEKLQGVVFGLFKGNEKIAEATTNQNGIARFENVLYGDYTVKELKTLDNYVLSNEVLNVSVKQHNQTYQLGTVKNTLIRGNIELIKVNAENTNEKLQGVVFGLFKGNEKIAEATTNQNGIARFENVLYGDYTVKELKTLDNYVLSNEVLNVSVKQHNQTYQLGSVKNTPVRGIIEVLKVAEHDENVKVAGAVFGLYELQTKTTGVITEVINGETVSRSSAIKERVLIATATTNAQGIVTFKNVLYGNYEVRELEAPKGYKLPQTPIQKVSVKQHKVTVRFTMHNEEIPGVETKAHGKDVQVQEVIEPLETQEIIETATMTNLVVGGKYKVTIHLVDLATKEVIATKDVEFIAESTTHTITESFTINGFKYRKGVTFSEDLYREYKEGQGYILLTQHNTEYDDKDQTITFKQYGSVTIKKVDINTKEVLKEAEFGLYRDGQLITTATTDENGIARFEHLIEGVDYEIKEIKAPLGYLLSDEVVKVNLNKENIEKAQANNYVIEYTNTLPPIIKKSVETSDATQPFVTLFTLMMSGLGLVVLRKRV